MRRLLTILLGFVLTSCRLFNSLECDGDCYDGEGVKNWNDGGIERGTWKDGELIGNGYQYFGKKSDFAGDFYEGEFRQGYHGFGTYYFSKKDVTYTGDWKNGRRCGNGKLIYGPDSEHPNRTYNGEWENSLRHGYGVEYYGDSKGRLNCKYEGEWKDGMANGFGRFDSPRHGSYIGYWKDDKRHGEGMYIMLNGDTISGKWVEDYNRDVALILYGESASTFATLLDEIYNSSLISGQEFIDALVIELNRYQSDTTYKINTNKLNRLLESAILHYKQSIPQLEQIEEYDKRIPYKSDYINEKYSVLELLNSSKVWLDLYQSDYNQVKRDSAYNNMFHCVDIVTARQDKLEKTRRKFKKKYW